MSQSSPTPIARQMTALGISHNAAAPFIGVTVNWMWDLYSYADEAWTTLSLVQICRLAIVLSVSVDELALTDISKGLQVPECQRDQQGILQVAGALRNALSSKGADNPKLDWDGEDVKRWLSDDEELADIPVPALHDICSLIGCDTLSIINQYLTKLGKVLK